MMISMVVMVMVLLVIMMARIKMMPTIKMMTQAQEQQLVKFGLFGDPDGGSDCVSGAVGGGRGTIDVGCGVDR